MSKELVEMLSMLKYLSSVELIDCHSVTLYVDMLDPGINTSDFVLQAVHLVAHLTHDVLPEEKQSSVYRLFA